MKQKIITSNFLEVSLPDIGPLSAYSCLYSLINLITFFSSSGWITTFKHAKTISIVRPGIDA